MSVLSNVSISLAGKVVALFLMLGSTMILARLLTPEELGTYAIVAGLSALLAAFKNFGTSNYLIQNPELTKRSVASALTVTALISWSVGALLAFSSESLAQFFEQPDMRNIANVLAVNFLFAPWLAIGTAILIRQHRFRDLVLIETVTGIVHAVVGIGLVLAGLGPLALALGVVAHSLTGFFAFLLLRLPAFTLLPGFSELGGVLRFGAWSSGVTLANQLSARGNELVIGKHLGVDATAMFDKGFALARLVAEQLITEILRVLLPVFAEKRRLGLSHKKDFLAYFGILASILGPTYAFLAVHAQALIDILFGAQWGAAAPIATIAAVEFMLTTTFALGERVMIAEGLVRRLFALKLKAFALRLAALLALVWFGLVPVAIGLMVAAVAYVILMQMELRRMMGVTNAELLHEVRGPAVAVAATVMIGVFTRLWLDLPGEVGPLVATLSAGLLSFVTWVFIGALFQWAAVRLIWRQVAERTILIVRVVSKRGHSRAVKAGSTKQGAAS
jgi:O-antigen/teichoic acid export membrane protein